MADSLRCPFCQHASVNESAVATSRLLAVHLATAHLDVFHELAFHVSDELDTRIGERAAALRAPAADVPVGLRARITTNLNVYQRRVDRGTATDFDRGKVAAFRVVLSMLDPLPEPSFRCGRAALATPTGSTTDPEGTGR